MVRRPPRSTQGGSSAASDVYKRQLLQLENFGKYFPNHELGIRFNVGIGSGAYKRTTTGGVEVSFGIYKQFDSINKILSEHKLILNTVHLHIGSGSDPELQTQAAIKALEICSKYPTVTTLNLGGGYKVARMMTDKQTSISELSESTAEELIKFEKQTHRKIQLEIEPGTSLIAMAGYCLLYTSPSPRDLSTSRMPSSA
eukprot:TRINITY_DN6172_c0_g1_i1.p1 TRINITY_DN6172_c0_g1~~TRINITY_DN6172_c0_g1_i1.p1  ORF type:complete len:199 (+),score=69.36 TRINITY_DN6172_c0_g1_i1:12-608(+)